MTRKHTVIGAGHGGKAMAAHLALMGFSVTLFNRTASHVEIIKKRGGIELDSQDESGPRGFAKLAKVTSDIGEALEQAEVIQVALPSSAHADIAAAAAPHLKDGQVVILHPGRTCGALEFVKVIRDRGCAADVTVAEAETFIYASRSDGPAQARIFRIKEAVPLAALPASRTAQVLEVIHEAYPQFIDGVDVLNTGLNNMGAIFHPALTLLNAGWIESTHGDYQFYIDGVTPSVARMLEVLDRERVTVASALGIRARTALEWLRLAYAAEGEDLYEAIHNQPGYYGIKAPPTLQHRYLFEDIPMSLVPIASIGKRYGVAVGAMESVIKIGSIIHRTDYWRRGRTVEKLGLEQWSVSELTRFVQEGVIE
ncbi:MAG: NADP transhydrogenase subunit alpha [Anaerolineae bacterium CFX3]|jgi:opine dehydrogenase|nr:Opine dehydrogenase [Anaerolineales bacterium]MCC7511216.1 NAD/NADP octopine/nopaline dehydrogenase family protein [Anaerolineae bacterium]MCE7905146.1 NADP transhydrogenase subunit alpha [Anaerolineae bacterium CFX3]GER77973.1 NADP transhydrogenase subunit alpha [Candidatus Denitrolinea symbiosum]MBW7919055.1 NAD/NADP octopine/nopaline dehydrogenase family protein [Anaerolineales bacterium]